MSRLCESGKAISATPTPNKSETTMLTFQKISLGLALSTAILLSGGCGVGGGTAAGGSDSDGPNTFSAAVTAAEFGAIDGTVIAVNGLPMNGPMVTVEK